MGIDDKDRVSFLRDEYLLLQNLYEDFDRRSLTIKGWVASGAIAGLAISFSTAYRMVIVVPLFIAAVAVVFWYLETTWKLFQYALSDRIRIIEAFFRDDPDIRVKNPAPFQIYHSWFQAYVHDEPLYEYEKASRPKSRTMRFRRAATQFFVCGLYLVIIVLSLLSCVLLVVFPAARP